MGLLGKKKERRNFSGDPDEFRLTLVEHLEELRDRIIRVVAYLGVGWGIGWVAFPHIYKPLENLVASSVRAGLPPGTEYQEVVMSVSDLFLLTFKLSFSIGLVLTFPLIVLELWGFIAPALKPEEQKPFKRLAPISFLLFAMGAGFCWLIIPATLKFFAQFASQFPGIDIIQPVGTMTYFVLKMMLAFGIAFQLPLIVYALGAIGLLSADTLFKYWRQAATIIFIASAIITPSADAFSMAMMAIPLVILFIISAYCVRIVQRKRERAEAALEKSEASVDPYLFEPAEKSEV